MNDSVHRARLGAALRALRRQKDWTLAEVSRRTGFSVPTLSKVENDRLSLSYDKLIRLSEGLGVDIAQLFTPVSGPTAPAAISGRRSVNRQGDGELVATTNYDYFYLSTDVTRKKFIPIIAELRARSIEEFGELVRHSGEEFIYVLEGEVEVHTELYAPLLLSAGDSAYLDSSMGHAYVLKSKGPCRLLAVCSASERDLREAITQAKPREATTARPVNARQPRRVRRHK
ncbi:MAG TPA: XRE family transcriptional regulator [Steroidobacteraceae bacterium]|nr:XRE family transcriptional regulator [Steroidobacteraceae bacterium]